MGRIGRDAHHADAELVGGLDVHVVEARAAQGHNLHSVAGHTLDDVAVALGVDEDAHCVSTLRQRNGVHAQTFLVIVDVESELLIDL